MLMLEARVERGRHCRDFSIAGLHTVVAIAIEPAFDGFCSGAF
jgi:hypothetical protein